MKSLSPQGKGRTRKKYLLNRGRLEKMLTSIGWSFRKLGSAPWYQIENHENKCTPWVMMSDRIEADDAHSAACFYFKDCYVELIDKDCVSVFAKNNESVFINFMNHTI